MTHLDQYQYPDFIATASHHGTSVPATLLLRCRHWTRVAASHHGTSVPAAFLPRRRYRPRVVVPDGLRTRAQAAAKLCCSLRTLDGHVASGALRYVVIGHGKKRPRRMFTDADLNEFIANQTRKDVPCPSTRTRVRRSGNLTSGSTVVAFTAQPRPGPNAKRKK
jgi:hypothetical protein